MQLATSTKYRQQWVYGPGSHVVPAFKERKGNWRPDYLMEKTTLPNGRVTENPRVCEINARLPWNALIAIPHIAQGFESLGIEKGGLKPAMPLVRIPVDICSYAPRANCHERAVSPIYLISSIPRNPFTS